MRWTSPYATAVFLLPLTILLGACGTWNNTNNPDKESTTSNVPSQTTNYPATKTTSRLPQGYRSAIYSRPESWLCLPSIDDICGSDHRTTAIYADGKTEETVAHKNPDPLIDCFYVYPTASLDMSPNSDLVPDAEEELATAWSQISRYNEVCDIYAPVYRQRTVPATSGLIEIPADDYVGGPGTTGFEIAYADVLDAFKHYLANSGELRGFILVGHSQGAAMLTELLKREIDTSDLLRKRFIAAHLLGGAHISAGAVEFETISPCDQTDEIGCIIAYNTFFGAEPPSPESWFGRTWHHPSWSISSWEELSWEDVEASPSLCVNPKTFNAARAELTPLLPTSQDINEAFNVTSPWVTYPGLVVGECIKDQVFGYLSVEIRSGSEDPRAAHIIRQSDAQSGLHSLDVNIALGDLLSTAKIQAASYLYLVSHP